MHILYVKPVANNNLKLFFARLKNSIHLNQKRILEIEKPIQRAFLQI
jgi:hypothetical protein